MEEAIKEYRKPNYDLSCSEATLQAANVAYNLQLDKKAMKLMAGFSGGLMDEHLCGVVAGSIATLSIYLTEEVAHQSPELKVAVNDYLERFDAYFGSRLCSDIKKSHRDNENNSCNPVIFKNAQLLDQVMKTHGHLKK